MVNFQQLFAPISVIVGETALSEPRPFSEDPAM
jgi:hypothetical protein